MSRTVNLFTKCKDCGITILSELHVQEGQAPGYKRPFYRISPDQVHWHESDRSNFDCVITGITIEEEPSTGATS